MILNRNLIYFNTILMNNNKKTKKNKIKDNLTNKRELFN